MTPTSYVKLKQVNMKMELNSPMPLDDESDFKLKQNIKSTSKPLNKTSRY